MILQRIGKMLPRILRFFSVYTASADIPVVPFVDGVGILAKQSNPGLIALQENPGLRAKQPGLQLHALQTAKE